MIAEAVVFFNKKYAEGFDYRRQRPGQCVSKSRFIAAQFLAYFKNDLWLRNARHANLMAQKMAAIFTVNDVTILYPVQANELFVVLAPECVSYLRKNNVHFYEWGLAESNWYRFVTSCFTTEADVVVFRDVLKKALA